MAWTPITKAPQQYVDSNGDPYSGAVLKFYESGTTTNTNLATDATGGTTASDVALNSDGYPEISGNIIIPHIDQTYKLALYPTQVAADADSGAEWTVDAIEIGAPSAQWTASGLTPTFVNIQSFTVPGDETSTLHVGRRIRTSDTGGTDYASIVTSVYTSLTTITAVVDDGGSFDSGLSSLDVSILEATGNAVPIMAEETIASAGTLNLKGSAETYYVTGTTNIAKISIADGSRVNLRFAGALTITHKATTTTLLLPGDADITTAAGDIAVFQAYADGVYLVSYTRDGVGQIVRGTEVTLTGTSDDMESSEGTNRFPAWVTRIEVVFAGVSTTGGTSALMLQLGDSGGTEATGYTGRTSTTSESASSAWSTGALITQTSAAAATYSGVATLRLAVSSSNTWVIETFVARTDSDSVGHMGAGQKSLTATFDRLLLTTGGGSDTFDAGTVVVFYS